MDTKTDTPLLSQQPNMSGYHGGVHSQQPSAQSFDLDQGMDLAGQIDETPDPVGSCLSTFFGCVLCPLACPASFFTVPQNTQVVVTRWGKYVRTADRPGIDFQCCCGRELIPVSVKRTSINLPATKVLDKIGNPLLVSAVVTYAFVDGKRTALSVDSAVSFLMAQAETVLKQVVSRYPYHSVSGEPCLKSEPELLGKELSDLLNVKVAIAGARVHSFVLKEVSYSPEVAQAMLKRQAAQALLEAREVIVRGAMDIVSQTVNGLEERGLKMDEKEKTRIVSNLLTVICSESEANPVVRVG